MAVEKSRKRKNRIVQSETMYRPSENICSFFHDTISARHQEKDDSVEEIVQRLKSLSTLFFFSRYYFIFFNFAIVVIMSCCVVHLG